MSGFVRNDWKSYLNGGTSHYNFSYKSEAPHMPIEETPAPMPVPIPPVTNTLQSRKNNKNKIEFPVTKQMTGGKRKSRRGRSHKKNRLARLTRRR
jgi:hypothetical protein